MLFQQLKSTCSIKIEADYIHSPTGQLNEEYTPHKYSPIDASSIAVANYNFQHNNISNKHLLIEPSLLATATEGRDVSQPTSIDKEALPQPSGCIKPLLNFHQQLSIEPSLLATEVRVVSQPMLLNQIYHYFGHFSWSTACNMIRFRECSLTLLDKLWYLYSYIYKSISSNTTTIIFTLFYCWCHIDTKY